MSLPHVLLGLLAEQPRTGYDLERAIREDLGHVWRAELSQIYPALARLRRAGWVHLKVLGPRRGPRRNLYRVTAAGRRELRRWVAAPPPARGKDEVLVRVAFLDALPPEGRGAAVLGHERALGEQARLLRSAEPPGSLASARRGALEQIEASRRWLRLLASETPGGGAATILPKKK
ncbi:MAG TPA: PadR family transcriptional regulator [Thermoanaerobaculia bacterium]|nr:PadR family transcriptional regulator [Thermoanaerobaculia bacterium]HMF08192.1 PadR family transcriptional regulator [Thermoanaerobaculia bacterium]